MPANDSRPTPDRDLEARLRDPDLGLPPRLRARLDGRDDLRRALATALRLVWSPEGWAARQGEELCRALALTEPVAAEVLLAPLRPGPEIAHVRLTDGPWLPLALLARLASEATERGGTPWSAAVEAVTIADTDAPLLPPLPERLRSLTIERAPHLEPTDASLGSRPESLTVTDSPRVEPWESHVLAGHRGWVSAIGWDRSGSVLATAGADAALRLWSPRSAEPDELTRVAELEGHARPIVALAWNPRSLTLATASPDGTVRIWEKSAGRWHERAALVHPSEVTSLAWSPDGLRLATASDDPIVRVWAIGSDGWSAEELSGHGGLVQRIAWAPDGVRLASAAGDHTARLWVDGGARFESAGVLTTHGDWVRALAWAPDGDSIVTGSDDGTAHRVRVRAGALARMRKAPTRESDTIVLGGAEGWVRQVAFDAAGTIIATAADDGVFRIYDFTASAEEKERAPVEKIAAAEIAHPSRIAALAPSAQPGTFATGDDAGTLRVVRGGAALGGPAAAVVEGHGHEGTIGAISWHPTRAELWTGSDDRSARVWRPARTGLGPAWGQLLGR